MGPFTRPRRGHPRRHSRAARLGAALAAVAVLISGCGMADFRGVYDMPLPGGADVGDQPYTVRAHFADVLDLVPQSAVRVNDVPVGRVTAIGLAPGSWNAEVTMELNGDVRLPANAEARLRQSSLLGEKFVDLTPPGGAQPAGGLRDGALIPIERTNRNPAVEEVLGAMSLLLNGGGVAQLQTITRELNAAMSGREPQMRALMENVRKLTAGLDAQRNDITRALDGMNRLSATLANQRADIDTALRDIGPGLQVIDEQRGQLVTMLRSMDRLSNVATDVIGQSKEATVHDLQKLAPTLRQLGNAGENLPKAFEILLTFPFPDSAVQGIKGDYTNLYADVDLNLQHVLENTGRSRQPLIQPGGLKLPLPNANTPKPAPPPQQPKPSTPKPSESDSGGGGIGGFFGDLFGGDGS